MSSPVQTLSVSTTRTLKTQAGMMILHYAYGDLKILINELDVDDLTAPDSRDKVYKLVYSTYKEHLNKKLPKAMERAIWDEFDSVMNPCSSTPARRSRC